MMRKATRFWVRVRVVLAGICGLVCGKHWNGFDLSQLLQTKRRQISKAMRKEHVSEIMKVVSSIDTSSHEDGHTVCEPERQVGDELALVSEHPVDSYGIARSHSAGSMSGNSQLRFV